MTLPQFVLSVIVVLIAIGLVILLSLWLMKHVAKRDWPVSDEQLRNDVDNIKKGGKGR